MSDSKSSKPAHKKNGKQKYCHCKPTCGKLLSERGWRHHYSLILNRSTIESSESGDESDSEDDSWSQMEVDPPSSNHHETFDFVDIPDLLGLDQDNNAAMEIDNNASPAEYESESEHEYDGGLDFIDPDDDEWKEFDKEDD
ncbi:hypothetical protein K438DRAFT_1984637 [Mycena galopus ATCC 62051]|nr:hypothetical protein K438DRAFT_1984637 [Mycena galopus ATCC 62051]